MFAANAFLGGVGAVVGFALRVITGIPGLVSLVTYIFGSIGLYTIARSRGLRHAWLAWIPIADSWVLGSVSDQYRYVVRGQIRSSRNVLLILNIISVVLGILSTVLFLGGIASFFNGLSYGIYGEAQLLRLFRPGIVVLILMVILAGVSIAYAIFYFIALNDVYVSCDPANSTLYLVFSILFRVTEPFFLFFSRERELGMPPRRTPVNE